MVPSATASSGSPLPPKPPDPDLVMVFSMDLNPRPPPEPPDPPDPATPSQSRTFTTIIKRLFPHLKLGLVDSSYLLVLSVSHSSRALSCNAFNLFVSTIFKPRTLEVSVVSFDVLRLTRAGSIVIPLPCSILSILHYFVGSSNRSSMTFGGFTEALIRTFMHISMTFGGFTEALIITFGHITSYSLYLKNFITLWLLVDSWLPLSSPSCRYLLRYFFSEIMLQVGSPGIVSISPFFSNEKCLSSPFLFSMKGDGFLVSLPSISFSFFTGLSSCVAVCTGSEDATFEITSVFLIGENWLSTSLVTISRISDLVIKALSTQSSFALISLSSSFEELSILTYVARLAYVFSLRGWLISSVVCCNQTS